MTPTPEQLQAAERRRQADNNNDREYFRNCNDDSELLADVAIALLAERDQTPVDESWLRSVGFAPDQHNNGWWQLRHHWESSYNPKTVILHINPQWGYCSIEDGRTNEGDVPIPREVKTRGDVLHLLSALGIKGEGT